MPQTESEPSPLSRIDLLRLAQSLGVSDADVMTRAELRTAIEKARLPEPRQIEHPTTWVSVARRLLASVVERGLNLPDAAALIRGDAKLSTPPKAPPPVATVTLARIYAAQGHVDRAIRTLNEVLESDPDHELARELQIQLELRREELHARGESSEASVDSGGAASRSEPPSVLPPVSPREVPRAAGLSSSTRARSNGHEPRVREPSSGPVRSLDAAVGEPLGIPEPPDSEVVTPRTYPPVESPAEASRGEGPGAAASEAAGELVAPAFGVAARAANASASAPHTDFHTEPPTRVGPLSLDWETPVSPSVEPLSQRGSDFGASIMTELDTEPPQTETTGGESAAPELELPAQALVEALAAEALTSSLASLPPIAEGLSAEPSLAEALAAEPYLSGPPEPVPSELVGLGEELSTAGAAPANVLAAASSNGIMNSLPNGVLEAPRVASADEPPMPDAPGLLLIETDSPLRYLYWELGNRASAATHWITVVTHAPGADGHSERRERQFPVHRKRGALRLEGVPRGAVIRAKLSPEPASERPLVVASSVRPRAASSADFEIRYTPHASLHPEAIALRARPSLDSALSVYWDD
jgi:tetratricopeptide repeat protein